MREHTPLGRHTPRPPTGQPAHPPHPNPPRARPAAPPAASEQAHHADQAEAARHDQRGHQASTEATPSVIGPRRRPRMRIATWNVNSLKARLPRVEEWLADKNFGLVALH